MGDQRDCVLKNVLSRNLEETFHRDQMDMTKETGRVRGKESFLSGCQTAVRKIYNKRISDNTESVVTEIVSDCRPK